MQVSIQKIENRQTYYYHLNGLKGMSCIFVMIGHYLGLYKYAETFTPSIDIIDFVNNSKFAFMFHERYWLYLFFVVSGYLVSKSKIENLKDLMTKIVNRFLRLALPILFSYFFIYLIYLIFGVHAVETNTIFQNKWYQSFYQFSYSIKDVLFSPIFVLLLGKHSMNWPYWCLRMMFLSSIVIYVIKFTLEKSKKKYESFIFSLLIIFVLLSYFYISEVLSACLVGMLVSLYEKSDINTKSCYAFWFIFVAMAIDIFPRTIKTILFFASLIIYIPQIKPFNSFFSSKLMQFLGNISWGIYSFHWPIICSLGALSILKFTEYIGLTKSYYISFMGGIFLTFVLSIGFNYFIEPLITYIKNKIINYFYRILNNIPIFV